MESYSKEFKQIMISLLNYDPEKRPTLEMLKIHPWVIKKHKPKVRITNRRKIMKIQIEDIECGPTKIVEGTYGNLYWGSPVKV